MSQAMMQELRRTTDLREITTKLEAEVRRFEEITDELEATYEARIANAKTDWVVKLLQLEQRKAMKSHGLLKGGYAAPPHKQSRVRRVDVSL
jgi:hypothetical protein